MAKTKTQPKTAKTKAEPKPENKGRPEPPVSSRWKPGQSGNPGGVPKGMAEVRRAARAYTTEAIETLAKWMRTDNPKASISAAVSLLNRGWGMPSQTINATISDVRQMTDAELYEFLTGDDEGRGGEGAAAPAGDPGLPH